VGKLSLYEEQLKLQPLINIGTAGHVDHGKTTLIEALTGIWAAKYSDEIERGITLRLGYADTAIYRCPNCPPPQAYYTEVTAPKDKKCRYCGSELEFRRKVSFVDVPGHEGLMVLMLAGAALMDGAIFVIDASQPCPRPQTREHFMALTIIGVRNIVIIQNKVDIVTRERAKQSYEEIRKFIEGTWAEKAPIIPVSALHKINVDAVVWAIEELMPTPKRDLTKSPRMLVARSFDINKPGTPFEKIRGGVLGGTIVQGIFEVGDEIEIRPGLRMPRRSGKYEYVPLFTEITSLKSGETPLQKALPGGLIGVGTKLDPSITKSDNLLGNVVGKPGTLPPVWDEITLEVHLLERIVGLEELKRVEPIRKGEKIRLNVGTALTQGDVVDARKDTVTIKLDIPVCAEEGARVAISRYIARRGWRLIGYGFIK